MSAHIQASIHAAFARLSEREGYTSRPDQLQLALILGDLIAGSSSGAVEAPTGLGKSLAALIPAIAHGLEGKRVVVATYTNVLAEQYWRKDLPLALSLFDLDGQGRPLGGEGQGLATQFLIGRQRYACLVEMEDKLPDHADAFRSKAELGTENEFRRLVRRPARELTQIWPQVSAPPVCAARACPVYDDCYYYGARRKAEKANLVITNHSVVLQDAIMAQMSEEGKGLLGKFDYLILDEAHDFFAAACAGLEFEINPGKLVALQALGGRLERELQTAAVGANAEGLWRKTVEDFRKDLDAARRSLAGYGLTQARGGIVAVAPEDVREHPGVKQFSVGPAGVDEVTTAVADACRVFTGKTRAHLQNWEAPRNVQETARNYLTYIDEVALQAEALLHPEGVSVSFSGRKGQDALLRRDTVGVDQPLRELLWNRMPALCLSATLALDGSFEFFERLTGFKAEFEEVLPSPFDHASSAALYLPPAGALMDPTVARREGQEELYFMQVAQQLTEIITAMQGRTLALFHSRREMEAVYQRLRVSQDLPVYVQPASGAGSVGDLFKAKPEASLLALRSFWTGFDAPGETLSCVAIVRIPFEVPVDPPAIVRMAYLAHVGLNPFESHTLPMAKMMVRQGAGRLIRRDGDKGIIALLDARIRTKRYGDDILANLPHGMRAFEDIEDAVGYLGLAQEPC